jgi:hypothetical protein
VCVKVKVKEREGGAWVAVVERARAAAGCGCCGSDRSGLDGLGRRTCAVVSHLLDRWLLKE